MFFNQESYTILLQKARTVQKEEGDPEIIRDAVKDCLKYVLTVCEGENRLNTSVDSDRSMIGDYDSRRHNAHENAISSVAVLNRMAEQYAASAVFTGNIQDRHQVAAFCLELADWLFLNRRKVL